MTMFRMSFSVLALVSLSACAGQEPASRNTAAGQIYLSQSTTSVTTPAAAAPRAQVLAPKYAVTELRINVPRSLEVSEANTFLPAADIVWRGEPRGDRYAQVAKIFNDGLLAGTQGMVAGPAAIVEVEVTRFHCLTEKTRFTVGGNHAIHFILTVRDAATGAVLEAPREIIADVKAVGGAAAIAEDQAGRTQRVVVVERLADVIRRELSGPAVGTAATAVLAGQPQGAVLVTPTGL